MPACHQALLPAGGGQASGVRGDVSKPAQNGEGALLVARQDGFIELEMGLPLLEVAVR